MAVTLLKEGEAQATQWQLANLEYIINFGILCSIDHLVSDRVLSDKDEEDEAAPKKVGASNDPEEELSVGSTLHVPMIPMDKMVNTFKYPQNTHHSEQLAE